VPAQQPTTLFLFLYAHGIRPEAKEALEIARTFDQL
jgi:hypothetical protein